MLKKFISLLVLTCSFAVVAGSDYACIGTEPFWSLDIGGNKLSLSLPLGDSPMTEEVISRVNAQNTAEDCAFVVKSESITATVLTGQCSDGMSDKVYSNHLVFTIGDSAMYGCCDKVDHKLK